MNPLNRPTLDRLMQYYHYIDRHLGQSTGAPISSASLAGALGIDDTQVRKDLAAIGVKGHPRVGYDSLQAVRAIREVLGFDERYSAVVVGAGRLGGAIASFKAFQDYGLLPVAIFDNNPQKIGLQIGDHVVQPMDRLETMVREKGVRLGIITVPPDSAQAVADQLIQAGISALWNFAPTRLVVPDGVVIRHEHLAVGLAELSYHLQNDRRGE